MSWLDRIDWVATGNVVAIAALFAVVLWPRLIELWKACRGLLGAIRENVEPPRYTEVVDPVPPPRPCDSKLPGCVFPFTPDPEPLFIGPRRKTVDDHTRDLHAALRARDEAYQEWMRDRQLEHEQAQRLAAELREQEAERERWLPTMEAARRGLIP